MRGKNDVDKDSVDDSEDKIEEICKDTFKDMKGPTDFKKTKKTVEISSQLYRRAPFDGCDIESRCQ